MIDWKKDIKDFLKWYLSRYSYLLWVSLIVSQLGMSLFGTLATCVILSLLIAWRDYQFLDEDGFTQVYSIDKAIFDKLKSLLIKIKRVL